MVGWRCINKRLQMAIDNVLVSSDDVDDRETREAMRAKKLLGKSQRMEAGLFLGNRESRVSRYIPTYIP